MKPTTLLGLMRAAKHASEDADATGLPYLHRIAAGNLARLAAHHRRDGRLQDAAACDRRAQYHRERSQQD